MVSKLYQYLGVDQPNNSVIKQKKNHKVGEIELPHTRRIQTVVHGYI